MKKIIAYQRPFLVELQEKLAKITSMPEDVMPGYKDVGGYAPPPCGEARLNALTSCRWNAT